MGKRIGVVLSGAGWGDGSDAAETMLAIVVAERAGAKIICAAPDRDQRTVVDHLSGGIVQAATRNARVEAARLSGGPVLPLAELRPEAIDGLLVPGGGGAGTTLSDYADKHELCTVDPDLAKLLRALLPLHKPMGFIGLSALLAARVLGPVAGVRVTLGPKGTALAKHAAVMGADVRPATVVDVISDEKARVHTTPGFLAEEPTLPQVAKAIDELVRAVVNPTARPGGGRPRKG
ncbi:MAG TPA: isoprenoid biosynthesis protein ElbB [Polyangia bacterium]|jgi:enhancing lycopene biosynthesis protein 2|nr:isoprenoid biosynthesis protein ElbB [Polyangia bacterium]